MRTPWGESDHVEAIVLGEMFWVGTPSHGGMMIKKAYAQKHLSSEARRLGTPFGDFLCYEEDCQWYVAAWDLKDLWPDIFANRPSLRGRPEAQERFLRDGIARQYPDYRI